MSDFDEDYEEPFYQEVVAEETGKFRFVMAKVNDYRFYYVPFFMQSAFMMYVISTQKSVHGPLRLAILHLYLRFSSIETIGVFFLIFTFFTVIDIKRRKKPCFKLALPNIIVQTDLFFCNAVILPVTWYGESGGFELVLIIFPHIVYPVIPALIGILFVIGCFIDKKRAKKSREMKGEL